MKELNIDVWGKGKYKPIVCIDGARVEYEKRDATRYMIYHSTEKSKVTITVTKFFEINGRFWFLWQLLYMVISLFGLFDSRTERKCYQCKCQFEVDLSNPKTNLSIRMLKPHKRGYAADVQGNTTVRFIKNEYFVDKKARRRVLFMDLIKLVCLIAVVALTIILITQC